MWIVVSGQTLIFERPMRVILHQPRLRDMLGAPNNIAPEEGSSGKINCSIGRRLFRMNKLFYRKNLFPESFLKEGSSDNTNCSSGRKFFR